MSSPKKLPYSYKYSDIVEKFKLSNNLCIKIVNDVYLTKKTGIKHLKIIIDTDNFIFSYSLGNDFLKIITDLKSIIFTEFESHNYEILKLVDYAGFKFVTSSVGWIAYNPPKKAILSNCKLLNIEQYNRYSERIREIAKTFNTSYYEFIDFYKPFVREMYQDKIVKEWKENKTIIAYFIGDDIAAFTSFSDRDKIEGWMLTSCVDEKYRGTIAYYEMMRKGLEILLKEKKKRFVKVECIGANIIVQRIWTKIGFEPNYSTLLFCHGIKYFK